MDKTSHATEQNVHQLETVEAVATTSQNANANTELRKILIQYGSRPLNNLTDFKNGRDANIKAALQSVKNLRQREQRREVEDAIDANEEMEYLGQLLVSMKCLRQYHDELVQETRDVEELYDQVSEKFNICKYGGPSTTGQQPPMNNLNHNVDHGVMVDTNENQQSQMTNSKQKFDIVKKRNGKIKNTRDLKGVIQQLNENMKKLETQLKDERQKNEQLTKDNTKLLKKFRDLEATSKKNSYQHGKTKTLLNKESADLKMKLKEICELKRDLEKLRKVKEMNEQRVRQLEIKNNDLDKLRKEKESPNKRIRELQDKNDDLMKSRDELNEQITVLKRQLDASRMQSLDGNLNNEQSGSVETTINNVVGGQTTTENKFAGQNKRQLERELNRMMKMNQKYLKTIKTLECNKNHIKLEKLTLNEKIDRSSLEIKAKKREIDELKKSLSNISNELNRQKRGHDLTKKLLNEKLCEIGNLEKKLKMSDQNIKEINKNIKIKEHQSIKNENMVKKGLMEEQRSKNELNAANNRITILRAELFELKAQQRMCLRKTKADNGRLNRR